MGIWTLHFGIDNTGRDSQRGVQRLLRHFTSMSLNEKLLTVEHHSDMNLDVVGLLESDLHVSIGDNTDCSSSGADDFWLDW